MAEYTGRIQRYDRLDYIELPGSRKGMPAQKALETETRQLLNCLAPSDWLVLLDERGKLMDSRQMASWLEKQMNHSGRRLCFAIGGAWGFAPEVTERAAFRLSLSLMTLPHQLARLFFAEQLYRAFTILNNEPYHHD